MLLRARTTLVAVSFSTLLSLSACGTSMPNAGPLANEVESAQSVEILKVTPAVASQMLTEARNKEAAALESALQYLSYSDPLRDYRLHAGDDVQVSLWSFSEGGGGGGLGIEPSQASTSPTLASGIQGTPLGKFQIDATGGITLPYAGRINMAGKTEGQARLAIMARYKSLGMIHNPDATVRVVKGHEGIIVTGATGKPRIVQWNAGGISLSEAITMGLGDGSDTLDEKEDSSFETSGGSSSNTSNVNAVTVAVVRNGTETELPIAVALDQDIPLHQRDKVVLKKRPAVQVTMLGGGIVRNGLVNFGKAPTLASAIAAAQGLNPNTANSTKIFIFRQKPAEKPKLYTFEWADGDGIVASQSFPMENNDIVYVAESPIIPISRVLNTIFQMAEPALIARP
ncbi:polysaccharide biosynthesis/export family protein [Acetobacter malorum]|uniref:polysaccharide biosynthesis/export family protein n=3 Tax=Acetobacter malorum TaxID=178901 RepID=UPI000776D36F|nr:polysaccharide biosynthesis/export family protein [Acetobacter malorum]KXV09888.1 hypothetical protein AD930_02370 [Acetobacter malorum]